MSRRPLSRNLCSLIVLAILVLVAITLTTPATASSTSEKPLSVQLREVASSLQLSSNVKLSILQDLNRTGLEIDSIVLQGTTNASEQIRTARACNVNHILFGQSGYLDANSTNYSNATQEHWSETCWLKPTCVVEARSGGDIAMALKVIECLRIPFAVRSGGHNPNSGFGSIGGTGILIDLAYMNQLSLSSDKSTISVGPGSRWINVYKFLDRWTLSVIGTKEPGPGVGGSVLGGGDPFFPGLYGLICDNVKEFEVVLSNSTIVRASASEHSDLFVALKGGGPNFGIVSQYELYTVPLHDVYYEFILYSEQHNDKLFQALVAYQQAAENVPKSNLIFSIAGNSTVVGFLYASHTTRPAVFDSFGPIPTLAYILPPTNGTIRQLSESIGALDSPIPAKREIFAVSTGVSFELYKNAYERYLEVSNFTSPTQSMLISYQPLISKTISVGQAKGGNSLGIQAQPQNWFAVVMQWVSDADTASSQAAVNKLYSSLTASARARNMLLPFQFQNDAGYFQKPLANVGITNLARLKSVSQKYDQRQVFQTLQNGGFLLSQT